MCHQYESSVLCSVSSSPASCTFSSSSVRFNLWILRVAIFACNLFFVAENPSGVLQSWSSTWRQCLENKSLADTKGRLLSNSHLIWPFNCLPGFHWSIFLILHAFFDFTAFPDFWKAALQAKSSLLPILCQVDAGTIS
jgi:hypothetical protein